MSISAATNGVVKGAIIGAIGLLVAPQLTAAYIAIKAGQYGAKSLADEHNSQSGLTKSKEGFSEVSVG